MKRDMDFVRDLLFRIEEGHSVFQVIPLEYIGNSHSNVERGHLPLEDAKKLEYHLRLLQDAQLVQFNISPHSNEWTPIIITWAGHDFMDSIRSEGIWEKTKSTAQEAGGFTVGILKDLAKAYIAQEIRVATGIQI